MSIQSYDADYFINFFQPIPEESWCTGEFTDGEGRHCALGHLGVSNWTNTLTSSKKSIKLGKLLKWNTSLINDGTSNTIFSTWGSTPKERILYALNKVKAGEEIKFKWL